MIFRGRFDAYDERWQIWRVDGRRTIEKLASVAGAKRTGISKGAVMRSLTAFLVMAVASVSFAGAADAPAIRNTDARAALTKYAAAMKAADDTVAKAKQVAAKDLVASLEKAKAAAMKAGSLDDANAIAGAVDRARVGSASLSKVLDGSEWLYEGGRVVVRYDSSAVTSTSWKNEPGQWRQVDSNTIEHVEPGGRHCKVTFNADRTHCLWVFPDGEPPRATWLVRK